MTDTDQQPVVSDARESAHTQTPEARAGAERETPEPQWETPESGMETPHSMAETPRETPVETPARRDSVEVAALLVVVLVLTAASGWSAIALHGLAQSAGITSWLAWGAPIIVDGPLFQAAIALVVLKRRGKAGVPIEAGQRAFFWWMLAASELVSLIGNGAHAWMSHERTIGGLAAAAVAGVAPIAAMAVMHGLMVLIEVLGVPPVTATAPQSAEILPTAEIPPADMAVSTPSPGDAQPSPTVSRLAGGDAHGDAQETAAVSMPSPGDDSGDAQPSPGVAEEAVDRDARILALRAEGASYREIAAEVGITKGAVGKILHRLGAADTTDSGDQEQTGVVLQLVR
jgi:hypothetical protein